MIQSLLEETDSNGIGFISPRLSDEKIRRIAANVLSFLLNFTFSLWIIAVLNVARLLISLLLIPSNFVVSHLLSVILSLPSFLVCLFVCLFNTITISHWNSNNIPFVIRMNSVMKIITPNLIWIRKSRFNIESLLNQIIIIIFEIMPINPKFNKRMEKVQYELIKILINRRLKVRRIVLTLSFLLHLRL